MVCVVAGKNQETISLKMHALDILRLLSTYRSMILSELAEVGIGSEAGDALISSSYSFVTLDIHGAERNLVCRVGFELNNNEAILAELYYKDKAIVDTLRAKLAQKKFPGFGERSVADLPWPDKIRESIDQADKVASLCVNCTSGDSYRPGNFSTITIYHDRIELEQVNKMNAKSLDHKDNYSLRSLEFIVPLGKEIKPLFAQCKIGDMVVEFSDNSSENNRRCGERISEELDRLVEQQAGK